MGLSLDAFREALRNLSARIPQADETTGNFDLDAIDAWRRAAITPFFRSLGPLRKPSKIVHDRTDAGEAIRQK